MEAMPQARVFVRAEATKIPAIFSSEFVIDRIKIINEIVLIVHWAYHIYFMHKFLFSQKSTKYSGRRCP